MKKIFFGITLLLSLSNLSFSQDFSLLKKRYEDVLNHQKFVGGVEIGEIQELKDGDFSLSYKCTYDEGVGKDMYSYFFNKDFVCITIGVIYKSGFENGWREILDKKYQYGGSNIWVAEGINLKIKADVIRENDLFFLWYTRLDIK